MILTWESDDRPIDDSDMEFEEYEFHTFLFGVDREGKNICLDVYNCNFVLFIKVPENLTLSGAGDTLKKVKNLIYKGMKKDIISIGLVKKIDGYGYRQSNGNIFIRLEFRNRKSFYILKKRIIENLPSLELYNGSLNPMLLMLHRQNFLASGWITIDSDHLEYSDIEGTDYAYKVNSKYINPLDYHMIPPLKIMSWDIEVFSATGEFPDAEKEKDKIVQIGYSCQRYNDPTPQKNVLVLGDCEQVEGVTIKTFETEKMLICEWAKVINEENPDILIGYNIHGFDWTYIDIRCKLYNLELTGMTRLSFMNSKYNEQNMESSAYGKNLFNFYETPGITQIDLLHYFRKEAKLDSYKLDNVAHVFLGEKKDDVSPQQIFKWAGPNGTPKERAVVAKYCAQDTMLPLRLVFKQLVIQNLVEMSKCTFVPLSWLIRRGQQIKVYSQVMKEFRQRGIVFPDNINVTSFEKFEGATVLNCTRGIHLGTTAGLDFASLYPSIIVAHNLCPTTFVLDKKYLKGLEENHYKRFLWSDGDYTFITDEKQKGVVPEILERLWKERKKTKKEMKGEKDATLKAILNAKQLAIKVSMNSIYGVFGSNVGYLPIKPIAATVTFTGRTMIAHSKNLAEKLYDGTAKCKGIRAQVVYGDSVTPRTPIMIRKDGDIQFVQIKDLATEWVGYPQFKPNEPGRTHKQQSKADFEVWDGRQWTPVRRVIRHKVNKDIYAVTTEKGYVEVTEDHSLIHKNGEYIKPDELNIGTELFHSYPPLEIKECESYESKVYRFDTQVEGAKIYYKLKCFQRDTAIFLHENMILIFSGHTYYNREDKIINISKLDYKPEYVYDIETESGHFQAGVGEIIVKNTDSIYTRFFIPGIEKLTKEEQVEEEAKVAEECAIAISKTFKEPILLEFEQIMWNLLLVTKKRYAYQCWEPSKSGMVCKGLKIKGLQMVRRDNCEFVKQVGNVLLNKIVEESDLEGAKKETKRLVGKLLDDKVPIEDLIVSKRLRGKYKTVNKAGNQVPLPAHAVLAKKMAIRDPIGAPKSGDRVPYVFVEVKDKKAKQCDRIEDPEYVKKNNVIIDSIYYFEHQVETPLLTILSCITMDANGKLYPLVNGKVHPEAKKELQRLWVNELRRRSNKRNKQLALTSFFKTL